MEPQTSLWAAGAHFINGSRVGNRRAVGTLGQRLGGQTPEGWNHHTLTRIRFYTIQVCKTGAAGTATQAEERIVSKDHVMPDGRPRKRDSQLAPAMCQLSAEPKEHSSRLEVWGSPQFLPHVLG